MKKHARRLALMGHIPPDPKYIKRPHTPWTTEQRLEREGWVACGGGFADPLLWAGVYRAYMLDETHDISKLAALPHHPSFSSNPDYWMYSTMKKRKYVYYYVHDDRVEDRGFSFHRTEGTKTFRKDELKWLGDENCLTAAWACD